MDYYIKFYAQVNQNTVVQLQRHIEQALLQRANVIHLLLSTPGGSVHDGISIYNLLKGIPISVHTYNFGSVDSIGVVIFCAGTNRYSVPNARFLLHPVSMQVLGNQIFDEPSIEERLNALKADQSNIAKVVATTINRPVEEVKQLIHRRTTLEPEDAREKGLVTEIRSELIPIGANVMSIYDGQQNPQQIIIPQGQPILRGISTPNQQGVSYITSSFTIPNIEEVPAGTPMLFVANEHF